MFHIVGKISKWSSMSYVTTIDSYSGTKKWSAASPAKSTKLWIFFQKLSFFSTENSKFVQFDKSFHFEGGGY